MEFNPALDEPRSGVRIFRRSAADDAGKRKPWAALASSLALGYLLTPLRGWN